MIANQNDITAAKAWLDKQGVNISPRQFANASKQLNMSFSILLRFISQMLNGGQGSSGAPIAKGLAELAAMAKVGRSVS